MRFLSLSLSLSHRFTRVPIQRTGRDARIYHDRYNMRRKKDLSLALSLSLSCNEKNFFSGSTIANTSTWLGNARPTGGERKRRGSRVRLSVGPSVRLSVTNALLACTNELVPLPHCFALTPSPSHSFVRPFRIFLSFSFSFSSPSLPLCHSVSTSLAVPLSSSFARSLFLLSLPHLPLLLVFFLSTFRSLRAHTLYTALFLSLSINRQPLLSRKSQVRRCPNRES